MGKTPTAGPGRQCMRKGTVYFTKSLRLFCEDPQVVLRCRYSNPAELRHRLADIATAMASAGIRLIGDGSMTDGHHSHLLATGVELVDDAIGANP